MGRCWEEQHRNRADLKIIASYCERPREERCSETRRCQQNAGYRKSVPAKDHLIHLQAVKRCTSRHPPFLDQTAPYRHRYSLNAIGPTKFFGRGEKITVDRLRKQSALDSDLLAGQALLAKR